MSEFPASEDLKLMSDFLASADPKFMIDMAYTKPVFMAYTWRPKDALFTSWAFHQTPLVRYRCQHRVRCWRWWWWVLPRLNTGVDGRDAMPVAPFGFGEQ